MKDNQHTTPPDNKAQPPSPEMQKIAVNPNPSANANVQEAPFEKTDTENNTPASEVGTEITDGEGG